MKAHLVKNRTKTPLFSMITAVILITFGGTSVCPVPLNAQTAPVLPQPGTMVPLSPVFEPLLVKGIKIYPDNPLRFDFIVDKGDSGLNTEDLKEESTRLIKYFLTALTIPEREMWVNLSPYEEGRIISDEFGQTEMGRDLLSQDYILKQLTSSLMYPEEELGQKFWERVYQKAYERYGNTNIPVDTFNKVWIVPDEAMVYENEDTAFIAGNRLKVMLEEDYLALEKNKKPEIQGYGQQQPKAEERNWLASEIVREIILPEIEKEVNEGENFARLRQVYNAMILATWFKQVLRESLLGQVYVDQRKVLGVDLEDKQAKEKIYQQYLEAYRKGVYNYIKEDYDRYTKQMIPRKYFSGGFEPAVAARLQRYGDVAGDGVLTLDAMPPVNLAGLEELAESAQSDDGGVMRLVTDMLELSTEGDVRLAQLVRPDRPRRTPAPVAARAAQESADRAMITETETRSPAHYYRIAAIGTVEGLGSGSRATANLRADGQAIFEGLLLSQDAEGTEGRAELLLRQLIDSGDITSENFAELYADLTAAMRSRWQENMVYTNRERARRGVTTAVTQPDNIARSVAKIADGRDAQLLPLERTGLVSLEVQLSALIDRMDAYRQQENYALAYVAFLEFLRLQQGIERLDETDPSRTFLSSALNFLFNAMSVVPVDRERWSFFIFNDTDALQTQLFRLEQQITRAESSVERKSLYEANTSEILQVLRTIYRTYFLSPLERQEQLTSADSRDGETSLPEGLLEGPLFPWRRDLLRKDQDTPAYVSWAVRGRLHRERLNTERLSPGQWFALDAAVAYTDAMENLGGDPFLTPLGAAINRGSGLILSNELAERFPDLPDLYTELRTIGLVRGGGRPLARLTFAQLEEKLQGEARSRVEEIFEFLTEERRSVSSETFQRLHQTFALAVNQKRQDFQDSVLLDREATAVVSLEDRLEAVVHREVRESLLQEERELRQQALILLYTQLSVLREQMASEMAFGNYTNAILLFANFLRLQDIGAESNHLPALNSTYRYVLEYFIDNLSSEFFLGGTSPITSLDQLREAMSRSGDVLRTGSSRQVTFDLARSANQMINTVFQSLFQETDSLDRRLAESRSSEVEESLATTAGVEDPAPPAAVSVETRPQQRQPTPDPDRFLTASATSEPQILEGTIQRARAGNGHTIDNTEARRRWLQGLQAEGRARAEALLNNSQLESPRLWDQVVGDYMQEIETDSIADFFSSVYRDIIQRMVLQRDQLLRSQISEPVGGFADDNERRTALVNSILEGSLDSHPLTLVQGEGVTRRTVDLTPEQRREAFLLLWAQLRGLINYLEQGAFQSRVSPEQAYLGFLLFIHLQRQIAADGNLSQTYAPAIVASQYFLRRLESEIGSTRVDILATLEGLSSTDSDQDPEISRVEAVLEMVQNVFAAHFASDEDKAMLTSESEDDSSSSISTDSRSEDPSESVEERDPVSQVLSAFNQPGEVTLADEVRPKAPKRGSQEEDGARGEESLGGINLDAALLNLSIERDGNGIALPLNMQPTQALQAIQGFLPIISDVLPAKQLPLPLSRQPKEEDPLQVSYRREE